MFGGCCCLLFHVAYRVSCVVICLMFGLWSSLFSLLLCVVSKFPVAIHRRCFDVVVCFLLVVLCCHVLIVDC